MFKIICDIVGKLGPDLWLYIWLAILAVVFLVCLILSVATGELKAFKAGAKIFNLEPSAKTANVSAKQMPTKIKKLYKRTKATGEKPSDVINLDACITGPYSISIVSKFTKIMAILTLILIPIGYAVASLATSGLTIEKILQLGESYAFIKLSPTISIVVIGLVGLFLTLIAAIVSTVIYKGAVKTYNDYVDKLDALSKGGNYDNVDLGTDENETNVDPKKQSKAKQEKVSPIPQPVVMTDMQDVIQNYNGVDVEVEQPAYKNTFETPTKLEVELEDEVQAESFEIVNNSAQQEKPSTFKGPSLEELEREEREEEERIKLEEARTRDEARAAALERARSAQNARAEESAAARVVVKEPEKINSTDDVIAKIEKIKTEGAPIATMKEVALLLQQERAKPENKTPEQQKKLNEALSSLLKAMSSAAKR